MEKKIVRSPLIDELIDIVRQHEALRRLGVLQESVLENEPASRTQASVGDVAVPTDEVTLKLYVEDAPPTWPRPAA
jgi:hypothetical protein